MLSALVRECGGQPMNSNAAMVGFICEYLIANRRPVFIDEGDHLFRNPMMLETLRDIHDTTRMPVIVAGMDDFERRLVHRKQYARRVLQWIRFKPLDLDDTRIYCDTVCEVHLADDLVAVLHDRTGGSIGLMAVGLALIEAYARKQGWSEINAQQWGKQQLIFTKLPRGSNADQ